jgi:hypothetical protein
MASVTFPVSLGGDGSTVTDDASPTTGLANGGHRTRFVPALSQMVAVANGGVTQSTTQVGLATTQASNALASANAAATSAASALTAPGTNATSTSSLAIGAGSKSLTLAQTGKSFVVGQWVSITSSASPSSQWMLGAITAFTSGTGAMTVSVASSQGTGTLASWVVAAAAPLNAQGTLGVPQVVTGTSQTMVAGAHYVFTNSGAVTTATLPASPAAGDVVGIDNATGRADLIVARNGQPIMGLAEDINPFDLSGAVQLRYIDATQGWRFI